MADILARIKKHKLKMFWATPYPVAVVVYVMEETEALLRAMPDHGDDFGTANGRCQGRSFDGQRVITIGISANIDDFTAVVAHECYHAMNDIYRHCGAYHDIDNDEPGAYFLAHLVRNSTQLFAELTSGGSNG